MRFLSLCSRVSPPRAWWLPEAVRPGPAHPRRPWPEVVDRISVTLAASRDAATRPGELAQARRLAEDAYWGEFEASDMETAVRKYLGFGRAGELERQFLAIRSAVRDVAEKRRPLSVLAELCHKLLLDLVRGFERVECQGCHRSIADRQRRKPGRDGL